MDVIENYLTAMRGQQPEWVPDYGTDVVSFNPSIFCDPYGPLYGMYFDRLEKGEPLDGVRYIDGFGVSWILDEFGPITEPGKILLGEIEEWHEKFTIPNPENYDWEGALQEEYSMVEPGKVIQSIVIGPFMQLVNAMGFENALVALITETDEVCAFWNALISFQERCILSTASRVKIHSYQLFDDIANAKSLFMSPETYRRLIKPYHARLIAAMKSADPDVVVEMHCCGMCQEVIDDFVEIGCEGWQPAQPLNNLASIKARYGNMLTLEGGWDNVAFTKSPDVTEEDIRASVRATFDELAPGGGFVFWDGGPVGMSDLMTTRLAWANDEAQRYERGFYTK